MVLSNSSNSSKKRKRKKSEMRPPNSSSTCSSRCPWKKSGSSYTPGVLGLHEEINDFYEMLSPNDQEQDIRMKVVEHITRVVHSLWPLAKVEVFGSFRTGLYLPSSDIDMVVIGEWQSLPLSTLSEALEANGIDRLDINIISKARVPLVRIIHTPSKIKVDISFNITGGVDGAKMIKKLIKKYPVLPKLVVVLKQFLIHRGLNEVYNGGMSSYCLTLLITSLLQGYHKPKCETARNLGTLLLEFFELYGVNFNYEKVSIHLKNGGYYQPRVVKNVTSPFIKGNQSFLLSVEDPLQEGNDVAKGSFLMYKLKEAFENAFYLLSKAVIDSDASSQCPKSYLKAIFQIEDESLEFRHWLISNYEVISARLDECIASVR